MLTRRAFIPAATASLCALRRSAQAQDAVVPKGRFEHLVAAYPAFLDRIDGDALVWKDGSRMPLSDGRPDKPFAEMLRRGSIADQLRQGYVPGKPGGEPPLNWSPGRIRHAPFFARMYGDCAKGGVSAHLQSVTWMPKTKPQAIPVTRINGVAGRMERIVAELARLPDRLKGYLIPSAGTYKCRVVADTGQPSMHASGAAIDIATAQTDYWLWAKGKNATSIPYRNRIPFEIVEIFEAEKFIWGGKWYHYDTMHFEYRPEMFV